jgi:5-hydroxyisourate hydrolase
MATVSSHVLDTSRGRPAAGVPVELSSVTGEVLDSVTTDADGRVAGLGGDQLPPGDYRLRFDTAVHFIETGQPGFYPEVVIAFTIGDDAHYHVPLLLNPFGYSTYRGS